MGGSSNDQGLSLSLDVSGNVVVTGYFSETVDFDPGVGTSNLSSPSPWDSNIFLAKYDASGNYLWANSMGGTNNDQGLSLSLDGSSNVLVTGYFEGTADFNPSPTGPASLTSVGQSDVFLAKYDANGNYLWANRMGGLSQDQGLSLALDGNNNVLITGYFFGQAQFEPGSTTPTLTGTGSNDIFLAKYASDGTYLWAKEMGGSTKNDQGNSLALDLSNNLVVAGFFAGISDFDPSSNIANLEAFSGY
jgi:uncharacterized membrane protein (UPF0136 family)